MHDLHPHEERKHLVFPPLSLTRLTFCLGAIGKHRQSSRTASCGVIIQHHKMRPLTGSTGKKKQEGALLIAPPPVRNAHTTNQFLVGVHHILVLLSLTSDPGHIWKRSCESNTRKFSFLFAQSCYGREAFKFVRQKGRR